MMNNKELFKDFPDHSRIWIYQSNRKMNEEEMKKVENKLLSFTKEWASHGDQLMATAKILNPYFAIVAVNDATIQPSGCSIDVLINVMKELGKDMDINFLDRMVITLMENGEFKQISFSELSSYKEAMIYDTMLSTLGDFREEWPRPIDRSSFTYAVR